MAAAAEANTLAIAPVGLNNPVVVANHRAMAAAPVVSAPVDAFVVSHAARSPVAAATLTANLVTLGVVDATVAIKVASFIVERAIFALAHASLAATAANFAAKDVSFAYLAANATL